MIHSFTTHIAEMVGMDGAVFLQHFYFWHLKNKGNNKHKHQGKYWTYNSINGFKEMFTYLSKNQIYYSLKKLEKKGYILKGNFNKIGYDRTSWYALTNKALRLFVAPIVKNSTIHNGNLQNGIRKIPSPIPDTDTFNDNNKLEKVKKFQIRNKQYKKNPDEFKLPDFNKLIKDL